MVFFQAFSPGFGIGSTKGTHLMVNQADELPLHKNSMRVHTMPNCSMASPSEMLLLFSQRCPPTDLHPPLNPAKNCHMSTKPQQTNPGALYGVHPLLFSLSRADAIFYILDTEQLVECFLQTGLLGGNDIPCAGVCCFGLIEGRCCSVV